MAESNGSVAQEEGDRGREKKNARDNLRHAGEFTKIENTAAIYLLRSWFGALGAEPEKASEIQAAGNDFWALRTLFEHFDSEVNSDPNTRTRESQAVLAELKRLADEQQEKVNDALHFDTNEDERINDLTDKTVDAVLHKLGLE